MSKLSQRGDTMVEVLIAIAVVSSVLGITYATMNRNIQTMRTNQERTEATRLAQGQIELLRTLWETNRPALTILNTGGFCISGSTAHALSNSAPKAALDSDDLAGYEAACTSTLYRLAIRRDATDDKLYRAYVRWDRLGDGRNEVMMVYRLP